jgi:hypothetical protein
MNLKYIYILLLVSCHFYANKPENGNTDGILIKWNQLTQASLNSNISNAKDSFTKKLYQNRLEAFLHNNSRVLLDSNSLRKKFLDRLENEGKLDEDVYVLEANSSGNVVQIKNYLIQEKNPKTFSIKIYYYVDDRWVTDNKEKEVFLDINNSLIDSFLPFGNGFNRDDLIISKFSKGNIEVSIYFLMGTASNKTGLQQIMSSDDQ